MKLGPVIHQAELSPPHEIYTARYIPSAFYEKNSHSFQYGFCLCVNVPKVCQSLHMVKIAMIDFLRYVVYIDIYRQYEEGVGYGINSKNISKRSIASG